MKTPFLHTLMLAAALAIPLISGCAQEVSHTESDKPGWFGGHKHEETTVYRNSDGTTSVEHEKSTSTR